MSTPGTNPPAGFDAYAGDYDRALQQGLSVSGESKEYFAEGRVRHLSQRLAALGVNPTRILDFGCGTGSSTPWLLGLNPAAALRGIDISAASIEVAQRDHGGPRAEFRTLAQHAADASFDLAFCNGVFHHIPPAERPAAARLVADSLKPGGIFAFWENNPWNPGTRWVMSRIPFDRDAIMLWPRQSRRLLRDAGLDIIRTDFLFVFPRMLRFLRPLERMLVSVAAGAQYLVLAQVPWG